MMKDLMGMMTQVKQVQERMQKMQDELEAKIVEGTSGGGLVTVAVNGKSEIQSIKIDPSLLKPDEIEVLEDLVVAAVKEATNKASSQMQDQMQTLTGGIPLPPGLKLF